MINQTPPTITTAEAVRQLAEVLADLIQHQKQTAEVVQSLTDKVAKLENDKANG